MYIGQCQPCEECYNLVQEAVDNHRDNLRQLDDLLQQVNITQSEQS